MPTLQDTMCSPESMPTLILTPRFTEDAQALWRAANQLGWNIERLRSWQVPDELRKVPDPVLYLEALFGSTLAEQFGLRLLEPSIDWLPQLPEEFLKRRVSLSTLGACKEIIEPAFIKPPNDKSFPAKVYTGADLPYEYDEDAPVLISEVVVWEKEFRCFVLGRQIRTISVYLRNGELQRDREFAASEAELAEAESFLQSILSDTRVDLPCTAVLDVGIIQDRGWAVVEQNAAWGSGIYGCDPLQVLEVLRYAAVTI
jgi:ATP-grasp domain, R2K clade family 2